MRHPTSQFLFAFAAIIPTLAFAAALVMILRQPVPDWVEPPVAEEPVVRPEPSYLELDKPMQVGVYDGRIQISMNLAFAARLSGLELLDLSTLVDQKQDAIMARMTDVILAEAETVNNSENLGRALRTALPPKLLAVVNAGLATDAQPAPVDEVLILDLMISPG